MSSTVAAAWKAHPCIIYTFYRWVMRTRVARYRRTNRTSGPNATCEPLLITGTLAFNCQTYCFWHVLQTTQRPTPIGSFPPGALLCNVQRRLMVVWYRLTCTVHNECHWIMLALMHDVIMWAHVLSVCIYVVHLLHLVNIQTLPDNDTNWFWFLFTTKVLEI